jgi:DNA repair ATPase RecN
LQQCPINEKVNEVARMLAGEVVTDLSIKHAKELIELASKQ